MSLNFPKITITVIALMMLISSVAIIPSKSLASVPVQDVSINPEITDKTLLNYTFDDCSIGEVPGVLYQKQTGTRSNTAIQSYDGSYQLCISKPYVAGETNALSTWLTVPGLTNYTLSTDITISNYDNLTGTATTYLYFYDGSQLTNPGVYLGYIAWIHTSSYPYTPAGQVRFHMVGANSVVNQLLNIGEQYHYEFSFYTNQSMLFSITGESHNYTFWTPYKVTTSRTALYPTYMLLDILSGVRNGTFYFDNIKAERARNLIDDAPVSGCMLTFDDAHATVYDVAYPLMVERGLKGTLPVVLNYVGSPGMTWDEINDLVDEGWAVASHSLSHTDLTAVALASAQYEILKSKQYIEENITGYTVRQFVAPGDKWNAALDIYARSIGYELTPYDFNRFAYYNTGAEAEINNRLSYLSSESSVFAIYTHQINDAATWGIDPVRLFNLVDNITNSGVVILTSDEYLDQRENGYLFAPTEISANDDGLTFTNNRAGEVKVDVALGKVDNYSAISEWVVIDANSKELVEFTITTDGINFVAAGMGTYRILSLSAYRSEQMQEAFSPIFAIIPAVIIFSVIPMIMGIGRKPR